jgi:hypothetical protein
VVRATLAAGTEIVAVTTDLLDRSHVVDDPRTLLKVARMAGPWAAE